MKKQQRKNTEMLAQILQDKIDRKEPKELLNGWFIDPEDISEGCGSVGCVAGCTYLALNKTTIDTLRLGYGVDYAFETWACNFKISFGFSNYFDINKHRRGDVFGDAKEGTLKQRLKYVQKQLDAN